MLKPKLRPKFCAIESGPRTIAPVNHTLKSQARRNAHKDSMSAEDLTALYFQQLDEKDVMDLFRVYKYDFLLFGYSFTYGGKRFPQEENIAKCIESIEDHPIGRHIDLITRAVPPKSIDDYIHSSYVYMY